jgi:hypothetical protein
LRFGEKSEVEILCAKSNYQIRLKNARESFNGDFFKALNGKRAQRYLP